ncbi:MAG: DUF5678 domain-containing protein [Candidatus Pacearchaeota archaeon]
MDEISILKQSKDDLNWFLDNFDKLRENYGNKVLAIKNEEVVAAENNIHELLSKLEGKGIPQEEVLIKQIKPKDEITIFRK